jgi:hypothetical protein
MISTAPTSADAERSAVVAAPESPDLPLADGSLLNNTRQQLILQMLLRGASPAGACGQLDIPLADFVATWTTDDDFRDSVRRAQDARSQNVAAALYRSAMEGSVTAQTFYLRHLPPPEWHDPNPHNDDDTDESQLTDDEIIERCRARRIPLPTEDLDGGEPPVDAP